MKKITKKTGKAAKPEPEEQKIPDAIVRDRDRDRERDRDRDRDRDIEKAKEKAKEKDKDRDKDKDKDKDKDSDAPTQTLIFPELVGKYVVKRELGRGRKATMDVGSYGTVYKVKSISSGERYAIKRILPTMHGNYILMEVLFLQLFKYSKELP